MPSVDSLRIPRRHLIEFSDYIASMLNAGLDLMEALIDCQQTFAGNSVARFARYLSCGLSSGESLSTLLASSALSIPPLYRTVVSVGEQSGLLARALEESSRRLREGEKARSLLVASTAYPVSVLILLLLFTVGLLTVFLPRAAGLAGALSQADQTRFEIMKTRAFTEGGILLGLLALPFLAAAALSLRHRLGEAVALKLDRLLLQVPLLGATIRTVECRLFVSALDAFTSRGMTVEEALLGAARVLENQALASAVGAVVETIERGILLSDALAAQPLIPEALRHGLSIAESTGTLASVLPRLKEQYDWEVERRLRLVTRFAEPTLVTLCGIIVLVFATTLVLPLFVLLSGGNAGGGS